MPTVYHPYIGYVKQYMWIMHEDQNVYGTNQGGPGA